jgi:phosphoribosylformimino-5-aminoimidazole carboxamide ribotide isomerase
MQLQCNYSVNILGGITIDNAEKFLSAGASHVIVTSYVFNDGGIDFDRLKSLVARIGRERLVLDLSCRRRPEADDGLYYVVTNKWTKFTDYALTPVNLTELSEYCDEFLVHGVDVEGRYVFLGFHFILTLCHVEYRRCGIEEELVVLLGRYCTVPVCYAGGVRELADLERVKRLGEGRVDCTVGSALDIFGGDLAYADVVTWSNKQ